MHNYDLNGWHLLVMFGLGVFLGIVATKIWLSDRKPGGKRGEFNH